MGRTSAKTYLAILGDLVASRTAPDRPAIQRELKRRLKSLVARAPLRDLLAAGPEITSGDEFQILLHVRRSERPGLAAMTYLRALTEDLEVGVTFGLGFGTLSTRLGGPIRELDGTCFHHAREALDGAKRENRWAKVHVPGEPKTSKQHDEAPAVYAHAANSILRLAGEARRSWTERQLEFIRASRTTPLRKDVAAALGIAPSVVSEALKAARFDAISEAEDAVVRLLDGLASPEMSADGASNAGKRA